MKPATIVLALSLLACSSKKEPSKEAPPAPTPDGGAAAVIAAPDASPAPPPLKLAERRGGPTRAKCEQLADHLGGFVVAAMTRDAGASERDQIAGYVRDNREKMLYACLQVATPAEVDCALESKDFEGFAACERFRRQVGEIAGRTKPTREDCERFYDRYRGFRVLEGADPDALDATRDQVIDKCLAEATPGMLACFLASHEYEDAKRRCSSGLRLDAGPAPAGGDAGL